MWKKRTNQGSVEETGDGARACHAGMLLVIPKFLKKSAKYIVNKLRDIGIPQTSHDVCHNVTNLRTNGFNSYDILLINYVHSPFKIINHFDFSRCIYIIRMVQSYIMIYIGNFLARTHLTQPMS